MKQFSWGATFRGAIFQGGGGAFFRGAIVLGGLFPGRNFPGGNFLGDIFPGGIFPGGIFPDNKVKILLLQTKRFWKNYVIHFSGYLFVLKVWKKSQKTSLIAFVFPRNVCFLMWSIKWRCKEYLYRKLIGLFCKAAVDFIQIVTLSTNEHLLETSWRNGGWV